MALNFPNSPTLNQVYTDTTSGFSYQWNGTVWISFSPSSSGQIKILDDFSASFNNSTQTFALATSGVSIIPPTPQSLIINLGGVIQDPTDDYSVTGSNIIFSTAPTSGLSFSGISLGPAIPIDYANNGNVYTRDTFTATAGQTTFTVTGTYTVGYLDVYQNGVRLSSGTDYTATNGTTFVLTTPANLNDEIESIGYKVASIVTTLGQFDNLIVSGVSTFIGIATHTGTIFGNNLSLTGITTIKNASGTVTVGSGTTALLVEGNARVTGILTVGSSSITLNGITDTISVGTGLTLSSSGIITGTASSVTSASVSYGLTGTPSITVGIATVNTTLSLVGNYIEDVNAVGALDIDCSAGNYFTKTIDGDSTFTVSNVPVTGAYAFTLELTHTSGTVTWFSGVEWPASTAPTLTTGKTHLFMFVTDNGGTRWRGSSLVDYTN
jgi:hypothetical protein